VNIPAAALSIRPEARPALCAAGLLLAPEQVFKADPIAAEVVKRCTGEACFETIVDDLAKTFLAPRERVLADVTALLQGLPTRSLEL